MLQSSMSPVCHVARCTWQVIGHRHDARQVITCQACNALCIAHIKLGIHESFEPVHFGVHRSPVVHAPAPDMHACWTSSAWQAQNSSRTNYAQASWLASLPESWFSACWLRPTTRCFPLCHRGKLHRTHQQAADHSGSKTDGMHVKP
jgi:hypothetical protein